MNFSSSQLLWLNSIFFLGMIDCENFLKHVKINLLSFPALESSEGHWTLTTLMLAWSVTQWWQTASTYRTGLVSLHLLHQNLRTPSHKCLRPCSFPFNMYIPALSGLWSGLYYCGWELSNRNTGIWEAVIELWLPRPLWFLSCTVVVGSSGRALVK